MSLLKTLFITVLLLSGPFSFGENSAPMDQLKKLYDSNQLTKALNYLSPQSNKSAGYYYNLGNIYFRLGRVGAALAYYEKANRIQPYHSDILHNLNLAQQKLSGSLGSNRLDPASTTIEALSDNISLNDTRKILGLISLIVILIWLRPYLKTRSLRKTFFQPAGYIGLIALLLSIGAYSIQRYGQLTPPAVSTHATQIHSGPGRHFLELGRLEAGIKVRILGPTQISTNQDDTNKTWMQVRYASSSVGWVEASHLLLL